MAEQQLLADLGGTNTRVALGGQEGVRPETVRSYRNEGFEGLAPLLAGYLQELAPGPVTALCAGVAGPVRGGTAQLTNHAWLIESDALRQVTGAQHIHLVNDLQAQGYALDDLPTGAVTPLFPGTGVAPAGVRLVLNLGTGCNVAAVHRIGADLFVPAAESGHSALPHASGQMGAFFDHLQSDHPHLPVEAALSGPGLSNLHAWLTGATLQPAEIVQRISAGQAPETLALFTEILATVAGSFALHHLPMGGLYLTGGLAPALAPLIEADAFLPAFTARGPYTGIVRAIPVSAVTDPHFALLGCARYLRQTLK